MRGEKEGRREGGRAEPILLVKWHKAALQLHRERGTYLCTHTRTIFVGLMIFCLVFSTAILYMHNIHVLYLFILFLFAIFLLMYTSMEKEKEKEKEKEEGLKKRKEERGLG
jgi:Ca2+/Na+ antiporter